MIIKDRLVYYNQLSGPKSERLATLFRFQNKPSSDYPQIYLPYDSILNHESRMVRNTKLWLGDLLTLKDILEIQLTIVAHDVREIFDGDISRLHTSSEKTAILPTGEDQVLLSEDVIRFRNFVIAQNFLENGDGDHLPTAHSIIARLLDTIDGNYFAFALLENYAYKVGGETPDPNLQSLLDRSYVYVNKMRQKYRQKVSLIASQYSIDLASILERLQQIEVEKLNIFSAVIEQQGYRTSSVI